MVEVSGLPGEEGLPVELVQQINGGFGAAIKRMLDSNDSYGSGVMREVILDEVNDLRRATLDLLRRILNGHGDQSRLLRVAPKHRP